MKPRPPLTVAVCIATIPPRQALLDRALASVNAQTRPADEVIVQVDRDGEGAGPTRNKAWRRATSDYIAVLDDDDEFKPNHLQVLMRVAKNERADVVYSWFDHKGWPEWTSSRPDPLATRLNGQLVHPFGVTFGPEQAEHMRHHAFIPATILVRRSCLETVGGYPDHDSEEYVRFNRCEDWALLIRLLDIHAKFVHAPERTWVLHHGTGTGGRSWRQELRS
jgi:glycosyltransferase involved in cell wall biosynthesis